MFFSIKSLNYCVLLQQDIERLLMWSYIWRMFFNIDKCMHDPSSGKKKKIDIIFLQAPTTSTAHARFVCNDTHQFRMGLTL